MTLEYGLTPDKFDYQRKGVAVDEIEINSETHSVTVRTGIELLTDADVAQLNEKNAREELYKIHVSSVDEEYVFALRDADVGGHTSKWKDGSTNQFVYVFEGIKGKILEVEYAIYETPFTWGPNGPGQTSIYLPLTETYGQVAFGYVMPETSFPNATDFSSVILRNRTISNSYEFSVKYGNYALKKTSITTPGLNDQFFDPFLEFTGWLSVGSEVPWQSRSDFFGGGVTYVTQRNVTKNEIEIDGKGNKCGMFIGKWV